MEQAGLQGCSTILSSQQSCSRLLVTTSSSSRVGGSGVGDDVDGVEYLDGDEVIHPSAWRNPWQRAGPALRQCSSPALQLSRSLTGGLAG